MMMAKSPKQIREKHDKKKAPCAMLCIYVCRAPLPLRHVSYTPPSLLLRDNLVSRSQLVLPTTSPCPPLSPGTVAGGGLLESTSSNSTIPRPALLQRELLLSRRLLLPAVLRDSGKPVDEDSHDGIEGDVSEDDTKVAPAMRVRRAERREKVVGETDLAVLAVGRGGLVDQVAAESVNEGAHEFYTGFAGGWVEMQDFAGLADDFDVCETD